MKNKLNALIASAALFPGVVFGSTIDYICEVQLKNSPSLAIEVVVNSGWIRIPLEAPQYTLILSDYEGALQIGILDETNSPSSWVMTANANNQPATLKSNELGISAACTPAKM